MKRFTLLIASLGFALAATAGAQAKDWDKIRIGTEGAYPPFNYYDSDKNLIGFDIDIAKALCERMEVECTFVAQDWDGIIPALLANKYDAIIASMSITEERKERVAFTNKYYSTPARFAVQKGAEYDLSPEGMADKTIGAQRSTVSANYVSDVYTDSDVKLYGTQDEANADLVAGRLDAVMGDSVILYEWLEKTEEGKCCEFSGPSISDPDYFGEGIGIAVRKGDDDLREMLNEAIAEIRADGTYEKINDKYFPFNIY